MPVFQTLLKDLFLSLEGHFFSRAVSEMLIEGIMGTNVRPLVLILNLSQQSRSFHLKKKFPVDGEVYNSVSDFWTFRKFEQFCQMFGQINNYLCIG